MKSFEQGNEWPEDVASRQAEQICNEVDQWILQDLLEEAIKYHQFTHPADPVKTDQLILDWYKSFLGIK